MMKNSLPDWLIIASRLALLGEIYPEIRAIAYECSASGELILIRYYLDREPIEKDWESISMVNTNLYAALGTKVEKAQLECIYSLDVLGKLNNLNGFIYARREYDD